MAKEVQEDRIGLDKDRYKRGQKYQEDFDETEETYIKVTNPVGDVTVMDVTDIDNLLYEITAEGSSGEKWIVEIVSMTPSEFESLKEY